MPPLKNRSTGASRMARTSCGGVISTTSLSRPRTSRTSGLIGIDFCSLL
ncbi:Uncharacterised protein [Mycobacteroides abscessus subsp. abscessus]|nr:Uncharacterised protein [Mycobacteroides abscessus subsp. abscessus]SKU19644.1 Uncharacterised protein [Mycobacteroides abscessus subsp. abscessus]SKU64172.1 Uncharacterised protein [Mycobacteroides abscessus subsp. abscessus]SKV10619.1 Uncharacterised protein [Mycobacteroides abscessus subsp. abscessus]